MKKMKGWNEWITWTNETAGKGEKVTKGETTRKVSPIKTVIMRKQRKLWKPWKGENSEHREINENFEKCENSENGESTENNENGDSCENSENNGHGENSESGVQKFKK